MSGSDGQVGDVDMSGHPAQSVFSHYVRGELDQSGSMALEIHLAGCAACRTTLQRFADPAQLERGLQKVLNMIDAPRRGFLERLLIRVGMREETARLVAATPSLRASWFAALIVALGFAVVAAHLSEDDGGILVLLVIAPLFPVIGVAAAYGPGVDPTYEIGLAAPLSSFRLLLLRMATVMVATTVLAGLASVASTVAPGFGGTLLSGLNGNAVAWLLPALGLTLGSVALSTVMAPMRAALAVGLAWLVAVLVMTGNQMMLFMSDAQVAFAALAVLSGLVIVRRREKFDRRVTR